ncbi:MAG: outer membrane protein assembly factor BamB [Paracoccaceae bacterium]|jgi:outer membrane protein assembly factor BamB
MFGNLVDMKSTTAVCSLLLGVLGLPLHAQWPDWRGPNGNGSVKEGTLPMEFDAEGKGVFWRRKLPGRGCSTPIVSNGTLYFLTSPIEGQDSILAYDLDGKSKWIQSYGEQTPGRGQKVGSGANSSAVSDGETVVAYFKVGLGGGLFA